MKKISVLFFLFFCITSCKTKDKTAFVENKTDKQVMFMKGYLAGKISISNLEGDCKITIKIDDKNVLSNISFELRKGEILGDVGESGSGKSLTALSVLKLLNIQNLQSDGEIFFNGNSLSQLEESKIKKIRGM